jgi:predicted CXXCH cytochrome family protein
VRYRLVRWVRGASSQDWKPEREWILETRRLTIGRASREHVQLLDPKVGLRHAVIFPYREGSIRIEARPEQSFEVNGRACRVATLRDGSVIRIGSTLITVRWDRMSNGILLEIEEPPEDTEREPATLQVTSLRETPISASFWSWTLMLGVFGFLLLAPLSASMYGPARDSLRSNPMAPSDMLWLSGPLHATHQFIGNNCNACHAAPFRPVPNERCANCHQGVQHHVAINQPETQLFEKFTCEACHVEHEEPSILKQGDPRLCVDCHGRLDDMKPGTKLRNITDFGDTHPDFRFSMLSSPDPAQPDRWITIRTQGDPAARKAERSHLKFSHEQHMNGRGIQSPTGDRVLECGDCHRPDDSGRMMVPIRMETACAECHSLLFDENDSRTMVPHGDLPRLYRTLQEYYAREYLEQSGGSQRDRSRSRRPGTQAQIMARDEQRRARDWADNQALLISRELLEKRLCVDCHDVTKIRGESGFDQWRLEPVRLTRDWMPFAQFDHASHRTTKCVNCHEGGRSSKASNDVMMPDIAECRQCHGGAQDDTKVASECVMCHQFHVPGRGVFDSRMRAVAKALTRELK